MTDVAVIAEAQEQQEARRVLNPREEISRSGSSVPTRCKRRTFRELRVA